MRLWDKLQKTQHFDKLCKFNKLATKCAKTMDLYLCGMEFAFIIK